MMATYTIQSFDAPFEGWFFMGQYKNFGRYFQSPPTEWLYSSEGLGKRMNKERTPGDSDVVSRVCEPPATTANGLKLEINI